MSTSRGAAGALVLAALGFGLATTGTKYALGGFAPVGLLTVQLVAATAVLWAVLLVRGYRPPASLWRVAVLGLLEPGAAYLAQNFGLDRTSAANGALVLGLESVFVVLLAAAVLRETITPGVAVAVALALVGLLVLENGGRLTGPGFGDLLLLAAALSAAGYTIVARGYADPDPLAVTAHQFAVASAALVPLACTLWATHTEPVPWHVAPRYWLVGVLVGVVGYGVSFLLYNWAIVITAAGPAAVVINLIPAFGFVGAVVLLGEDVTAARAAGAALITASVALFACLEWRLARQLTMISDVSASSSELVPT